ncbi:hypothetical protein HDU83_006423 [Entophlyctis luteolus]|nr:hypothetical protein HDU83_006423 [Entophlyctis luteolus]
MADDYYPTYTIGQTAEVQIHGQNPQHLIEKIIRSRIFDSLYWKEHCFGLSAESIVDKAIDLKYVGGQYGNQKPTEFLCLILRLLQLQPDKSIIAVYLQNEDHKYLTALAAFYLRLTFKPVDVYKYLEPLLLDKRKLRMRDPQGNFFLSYMDEFADNLLRQDRVCEVILPRITKRSVLVEAKDLEERVSPLEDDLDLLIGDDEGEDADVDHENNGGLSETEAVVTEREINIERSSKMDVHISQQEAAKESVEHSASGQTESEAAGRISESQRNDELKNRDESSGRRDMNDNEGRRFDGNHGRESRHDWDDPRHFDRDRGSRDYYRSRDERESYHDSNRRDTRPSEFGHDRTNRRRDYYDDYGRDGQSRLHDDRRNYRSTRGYDRQDERRYVEERVKYDDSDEARRRNLGHSDKEGEANLGGGSRRDLSNGDVQFGPELPSDSSKKKKYSAKKVNALFKKKKEPAPSADESNTVGGTGGASRDSMSIEETNKLRISMGMAPLKP